MALGRWTVVIGVLVWCSGACSPIATPTAEQAASTDAGAVPERRLGATMQPEWERTLTGRREGTTLPPTAFRAGGGLAAAVHGPSRYYRHYELARRGRPGHGGPHHRGQPGPARPALWELTDIVGIARSGHVWFLDREMGSVVSDDVGGFGELIARLGARGTVRSGCALGEHAIAFLDDARPWQVFVRDLGSAAATRAVPLPAGAVDSAAVPWASLRFGGSADGGCVLWSPRLNGVLVVTDSAVRATGPFVEPPPPAPPTPPHPWYARLLGRDAPPTPPAGPGALDATTFSGGVAVLYAGRSPQTGRLVDLYAEDGAYLETMRLPRRALRIAGTAGRIIAFSVEGDSAYLASYVLPGRVRTRPLTDAPSVLAPAYRTGERVLPADSAGR